MDQIISLIINVASIEKGLFLYQFQANRAERVGSLEIDRIGV